MQILDRILALRVGVDGSADGGVLRFDFLFEPVQLTARALEFLFLCGVGALEFFDVILSDVESHITWEAEALAYWPCTTERQLTAARAFRERLDIEDQLFVALNAARSGDRMPFQVPA